MTLIAEPRAQVGGSAELAAAVARARPAAGAVTVVGYGNMGREYVKALQAMGVRRIVVCARSAARLGPLQGAEGLQTVVGGVERLGPPDDRASLAIVATPTETLGAVAEPLARRGYRRLLIDKPVAVWSEDIVRLADALERDGAEAVCAYNRLAYPSFQEVRARAEQEGGVTSCTYGFTEYVHRIGPDRFSAEELARWGIANSIHVLSLAHGLIGLPATSSGHRGGRLAWHAAGAVFVGSGVSTRGIPFAYHADWGSTGRWGVEVHSGTASDRLCPLETLVRRTSPTAEWQEVPVTTFAPAVKAGLVEQVVAMLDPQVR
ncbi:MAG: Gfo/Idh/MocA family oxidoreductase, partial [Dehalococcoidia bacterium]|nr:Gfo/Idh/MocA family oxidoreductase [Dehalococcoidia bacterium]